MSRSLFDDYIILEQGMTRNNSHKVYHLECRKSGERLFVTSRVYSGKTAFSSSRNSKRIFYTIDNAASFKDALLFIDRHAKNMPRDWSHEKHDTDAQKAYHDIFQVLDDYITTHLETPVDILDIGAGYAWIDGLLQEKYDANLYLLDGDSRKNRSSQERDGGYGDSDSFQFYREKSDLIRDYDERGLRYNFIDAQSLQVPPICFSLILSFTSCGFHYPLSTYAELIKKHSGCKTSVIIDLRVVSAEQQLREAGFKLISILKKDKSSILAHIQPSVA